jgi:DNA-binding response OmpR family regulator
LTRCRVLVVDDDDELRESLVMALEASGHEVLAASDGREALACLDDHAVDVVVLDLMMPVLDGEGFLAAYRARGGTAAVIVVSAGLDLPQVAARLGSTDWLAKPFDLEVLEGRIARACGGGGDGEVSAARRRPAPAARGR